MAAIEIASGQVVHIPAIRLTSGEPFEGIVSVSDGETLIIEVSNDRKGRIPSLIDPKCVLNWQKRETHQSCPIRICSQTDRKLVTQVIIQERREAPRVRADIQLHYQMIKPDAVRQIADEVMMRVNALGDPDSETSQLLRKVDDPLDQIHTEISELRELIKELMSKVDRIDGRLNGDIPEVSEASLTPLIISNCSSTGVGFITDKVYQEGDYLRLHMSLPTTPRTVIDCVGIIVRSETCPAQEEISNDKPHFDLGVRFTHIHESDRERLIQYLFRIQRRNLRDRKEARQALAESIG